MKILSVQISLEFFRKLRTIAAERDMSISALVRHILEEALSKWQ